MRERREISYTLAHQNDVRESKLTRLNQERFEIVPVSQRSVERLTDAQVVNLG